MPRCLDELLNHVFSRTGMKIFCSRSGNSQTVVFTQTALDGLLVKGNVYVGKIGQVDFPLFPRFLRFEGLRSSLLRNWMFYFQIPYAPCMECLTTLA